jgi:hypothetical protein
MMLSPSAARLSIWKSLYRQRGHDFTTSRASFSSSATASSGGVATLRMGLAGRDVLAHSSALFGLPNIKLRYNAKGRISLPLSCLNGGSRWKSTVAAYNTDSDDDEDPIDKVLLMNIYGSYRDGHATAAAARSKNPTFSHEEAWMINLGRDDNNAWLTGPRNAGEWYTGRRPSICPGVDVDGNIRSLPLPRLDGVTRRATQDYFDNSWTLYETLFAGLNGEEYFYRPPVHGLRHPQIFYYGHTACLYVNKLRVGGVLDKPVNAYFESIFEVGVDEMLWDDMHKNVSLFVIVRICLLKY